MKQCSAGDGMKDGRSVGVTGNTLPETAGIEVKAENRDKLKF